MRSAVFWGWLRVGRRRRCRTVHPQIASRLLSSTVFRTFNPPLYRQRSASTRHLGCGVPAFFRRRRGGAALRSRHRQSTSRQRLPSRAKMSFFRRLPMTLRWALRRDALRFVLPAPPIFSSGESGSGGGMFPSWTNVSFSGRLPPFVPSPRLVLPSAFVSSCKGHNAECTDGSRPRRARLHGHRAG